MPALKCDLKLEINVTSCHFETRFIKKDFGSQNDALPPAVNVTLN